MSDLFSAANPAAGPLADRMRPRTLDEVVGHTDVLAQGRPVRRLLLESQAYTGPSVILWGPPGSGKTTLALLMSRESGREFRQLSAVTAGVKDVRAVIDEAKVTRDLHGRGTVLFIDEVHRFSKTQQDALLPAVEHGWVTLVAATTENPSVSVVGPLLSRSILVVLQALSDSDIATVLDRAVTDPRGLNASARLDDEARSILVRFAAGDARRALTMLDGAAGAAAARGAEVITADDVEAAVQAAAGRYDRAGDQHYDVISAFIKSMRGSDVDAALHYLARMLEAGEDPRFIARRIVIAASEDVGLADPSALQSATAALAAVTTVGMPEARIVLAQAVVHVSLAPKSNAAYRGINDAIADVRRGVTGPVPNHLRDGSLAASRATGAGEGYRYPHDEPGGHADQQYLPDALVGRIYYRPTDRGYEARLRELLDRLREEPTE